MSISDKYVNHMLRSASSVFYEVGLSEGTRCLVCRSWRKSCDNCQSGHGRSESQNGNRSSRFRQAAQSLDALLDRVR